MTLMIIVQVLYYFVKEPIFDFQFIVTNNNVLFNKKWPLFDKKIELQ